MNMIDFFITIKTSGTRIFGWSLWNWRCSKTRRIDVETIDFLNLGDSVNHNYHGNISLQGMMKVVHLDDFDFGMLQITCWNISQVTLIQKKNRFFLPLLVIFENNWEQNGWICVNNYKFDEIGVYLCVSGPIFFCVNIIWGISLRR